MLYNYCFETHRVMVDTCHSKHVNVTFCTPYIVLNYINIPVPFWLGILIWHSYSYQWHRWIMRNNTVVDVITALHLAAKYIIGKLSEDNMHLCGCNTKTKYIFCCIVLVLYLVCYAVLYHMTLSRSP